MDEKELSLEEIGDPQGEAGHPWELVKQVIITGRVNTMGGRHYLVVLVRINQ